MSPQANSDGSGSSGGGEWEPTRGEGTTSNAPEGDTLALARVISVSVQEFKNVFRKSLCCEI